jgi:hypothetical protein
VSLVEDPPIGTGDVPPEANASLAAVDEVPSAVEGGVLGAGDVLPSIEGSLPVIDDTPPVVSVQEVALVEDNSPGVSYQWSQEHASPVALEGKGGPPLVIPSTPAAEDIAGGVEYTSAAVSDVLMYPVESTGVDHVELGVVEPVPVEVTPAPEDRAPAAYDLPPEVDLQLLGVDTLPPEANDKLPGADDVQPAVDHKSPGADDDLPEGDDETPSPDEASS